MKADTLRISCKKLAQALDAPRSLKPKYVAAQYSWNYEHVSRLWTDYKWLGRKAAREARTHYGGFSTLSPDGLRVISINTDFIYSANLYNYINVSCTSPWS